MASEPISPPSVGGAAKRRERKMDGNFTIGRLGGVEVRLHWSLLAVFALIVWSLARRRPPVAEPWPVRRHLPRDGHRRGRVVLGVDPAPRARALVGGPPRGDRGRLDHSLAVRRRGGVQGSVREPRCRVPSRHRGAARFDRPGRLVRVDRACWSAERRRRGRSLARLHQPHPGRLQPPSRLAAGRRPRVARRALASQGGFRLGDPGRVRDRTGLRLPVHCARPRDVHLPGLVQRRLARLHRLVPPSGRQGGGSLRCDGASARRIARSRLDGAPPRYRRRRLDDRALHGRRRLVAPVHHLPRPRWGQPGRSPRLRLGRRGTPLGVGYATRAGHDDLARSRSRCSPRTRRPSTPWRSFPRRRRIVGSWSTTDTWPGCCRSPTSRERSKLAEGRPKHQGDRG